MKRNHIRYMLLLLPVLLLAGCENPMDEHGPDAGAVFLPAAGVRSGSDFSLSSATTATTGLPVPTASSTTATARTA